MELTLTITGSQGEAGVIADVIRNLQGKVTDMKLGVGKVETVTHIRPPERVTEPVPTQPIMGLTEAERAALGGADAHARGVAEAPKRRGRPPKNAAPEGGIAEPEVPAEAADEDEWMTLHEFRNGAVAWLKANPHLNEGATDVFIKHVGTNSGNLQDVPQSHRREFLADLAALAPAPNGEAPSWA